MPAKNVLKTYVDEGYYHIYNRGVEKRKIFLDDQDYKVFLKYLKLYLDPPMEIPFRTVTIGNYTFKAPAKPLKNYNNQLELLAYCLMPNHFHLLLKQKPRDTIEFFMRSLGTKYSTYFNKRYDRVGSLFQGPYKAVLIENDDYLLHLSRYIHLNPVKDSPLHMAFSSYADYLGKRNTSWINTKTILVYFKTAQKTNFKDILSYQSFVEDYIQDPKELIAGLTLD
jgi:putative transposase